jgi:hypothetical protein
METLQTVMYGFFTLLLVAAGGIGFWLYKKREEGDA